MLRDLALVRVETDAQRLVWNTLMAHEHRRGAGPFVGHQLRYLVGSAHGWLGGVGFAASARRLNVRDAWVGWDDARRRAHLHRVVGLCRMLIRPHVACRNLVSHVLGRAVRAVGEDFERLYGYRPWLLETFVDETGALARGLHLHTTLAVNPDGVPLGVLRAGFDAPAPAQRDETGKPTQSTKPREERKSFRWVEGLHDCAQAAQRLPQTRVVCTMDREADFLDLFIEQRAHAPHVELLVRAKVDRVLGKDKTPDADTVSRRLFDEVRNAPARGTCTVELNRLSARVKASPGARSRSCSTIPPSASNVPSPSRWWWVGASS